MDDILLATIPYEFEPFEYFCKQCRQLRLCINPNHGKKCGNCGSKDLIKGRMGELNKAELRRTEATPSE